jgi:flagellar hook-associated protein 3 FlgL
MNNTRISTGMAHSQSVFLMMAKQSKLHTLEQQLATGKQFISAKDNPVAAGTAVGLDRAVAELDRMGENGHNVQNRLGLQENVLANTGELAIRVNELTVQANNTAILSAEDKKTISAELRAIKQSLLDLSNATDGQGRYLFGGSADDVAPFTVINGTTHYNGDQTQRSVEIAPGTFVQDALPGSEVFMRVRTGDGVVDGSAAGTNTGTSVITEITRDGSGNWNGEDYRINFTGSDAYEVLDSTNTVVGTGTYLAGEPIITMGLRVAIEGTPANGDSYSIGAAVTRNAFSTIDRLIGALEMDTNTAAGLNQQQNLLQSSMRDVARMAEKFIDARASGGAQLQILESSDDLRESNLVTLKTTLSGMRDLDYAEAISQYKLESTALQAAQTMFSQMQSMSLFNMIR